MSNILVTELRSMTASVLTATTAAERGNWHEAKRGVSDVSDRAQRVVHQLASTEAELQGNGETRSRRDRPAQRNRRPRNNWL